MTRILKAILHCALDLRFGNHVMFVSKTGAKREQNATDSRFYPTHSVMGSRFGFFLVFFLNFSCVFTCVLDTDMLVS